MNKLKVIGLGSESIIFEGNVVLYSDHDQDCCEHHYLSTENLTLEDFEGLEFDLTADDFFTRIEDYGIALNPSNGHPVRIPGYGYNNGYYGSGLALVITKDNQTVQKFDITECQRWMD